jgi:hypothetical protein
MLRQRIRYGSGACASQMAQRSGADHVGLAENRRPPPAGDRRGSQRAEPATCSTVPQARGRLERRALADSRERGHVAGEARQPPQTAPRGARARPRGHRIQRPPSTVSARGPRKRWPLPPPCAESRIIPSTRPGAVRVLVPVLNPVLCLTLRARLEDTLGEVLGPRLQNLADVLSSLRHGGFHLTINRLVSAEADLNGVDAGRPVPHVEGIEGIEGVTGVGLQTAASPTQYPSADPGPAVDPGPCGEGPPSTYCPGRLADRSEAPVAATR